MCAPTGSGKSPIAITLANKFKSSFVVTASKSLQDQYQGDFSLLKPVKGKGNFACYKQMERKKPKIKEVAHALEIGLTCNKGECIEKRKENGKTVKKNCKFKPSIKEYECGVFEGKICPYYEQKYLALTSPHSLWNYSSYFQIMKFNQDVYGEYLGRQVAIFDEAHKIEDQILQFVGIEITNTHVEECGIDIRRYKFDDIDMIITLLDNMAKYYAVEIRTIENSVAYINNPDYGRIEPLEKKYDKVSQARIDIVSDKENFVINDPKLESGQFKSVLIVPLDISKFTQELFKTQHQIFMSATIDKDSFCETMGFNKDEVGFVDTSYSPFALENRTVNFLDIKRLNYKSSPEDEMAVINTIDKLMNDHNSERGIILTSSKAWCFKIKKNLSETNQKRIQICHARNAGGKTQNEVMKEHAQTPGSVLLSSSLWEGVDLKDDMSRFQIIAKIPYPNFTEKRTAIKKEKYPLWYTSQTLMKLLQGFGRSIRNEKDWARTYVLDASVHYLLRSSKPMVPKAFHDILGW